MWTIKPQTIYVMGGRMKVEFKATHPGRHGAQHLMNVTFGDVTCQVRFSASGEILRIEKLTHGSEGVTKTV